MSISLRLFRIMSVLVTVAYAAAVFGFDIHSSEEAHHSFVVPLFAGISCDHIHPDTPCHSDGAEGECDEHEDCCHDTIEVLTVPGLSSEAVDSVPAYFYQMFSMEASPAPAYVRIFPESGVLSFFPPPDLSLMCVLRV